MSVRFTAHTAYGVLVRAYHLNKGERIHRHSDPFDHTTSVACGKTRLYMFPVENHINSKEIVPNSQVETIPGFIEHEIEALEDGTVVINICPL